MLYTIIGRDKMKLFSRENYLSKIREFYHTNDIKENIDFLYIKNKGHNPNYTEEEVKLLNEFSKKRAKLLKKKNTTKEEKEKFVSSFDWGKMTLQDELVWNRIF